MMPTSPVGPCRIPARACRCGAAREIGSGSAGGRRSSLGASGHGALHGRHFRPLCPCNATPVDSRPDEKNEGPHHQGEGSSEGQVGISPHQRDDKDEATGAKEASHEHSHPTL